jgi:hypothetical protein
VDQPGVGEGPDEGTVRAFGVEDAERLGELARLMSLIPEVAALLLPGAHEPTRGSEAAHWISSPARSLK